MVYLPSSMIRLRLVLTFLLSSAVIGLSGMSAVKAYNVQASVSFPAPTAASTFAAGLDGLTVDHADLTVSGSCQITNPALVVTIWRSGVSVGSTPCLSGNFSLQIILQPGANGLTARTANASTIYGPDSAPITVYLQLPASPITPTPTAIPTSPAALTPAEQTNSINAGAAGDFQATTTQPFSTITDTDTVTLGITVSGGTSPYIINLDWGDGTTESHTVPETGTYEYTHIYRKIAIYKVHADIHDVLGASTGFDYAVISKLPTAGTVPIATQKVASSAGSSRAIAFTAAGIVSGAGVLGGIGYWLGAHHALFHKKPLRPKTRKTKYGKRNH